MQGATLISYESIFLFITVQNSLLVFNSENLSYNAILFLEAASYFIEESLFLVPKLLDSVQLGP